MTVPSVTLHDGVEIPQLGFGTYQIESDQAQQIVETAFEIGYRHIDTARLYGNEKQVGDAFRASGLSRDEVFITTKLWNDDQGYDAALRAFDTSMEQLGLDVLDLYLIHWPAPKQALCVETWRAFETLLADGRVRSIGVSNFRPQDLAVLADKGLAKPSVNQIELHPYFTQQVLRDYCAKHDIAVESWSPLGQGDVLDDPVIGEIASAHEADPAQIVLAWHLALGLIVFPKSSTPERIASNFAATAIDLSAEDVERISGVDRNARRGPDPAHFG